MNAILFQDPKVVMNHLAGSCATHSIVSLTWQLGVHPLVHVGHYLRHNQEHVRQSCFRSQKLLYETALSVVMCCTDPNCNDEAHYSHLCKRSTKILLTYLEAQYPLRLITRLRSTLSLVNDLVSQYCSDGVLFSFL